MTSPTPSNGTWFRSVVKGQNFITPKVKGFFRVGPFEVEWSEENPPYMFGTKHFGVTVVEIGDTKTTRRSDLSQCFDSEAGSWQYIKDLGKEAVSEQ